MTTSRTPPDDLSRVLAPIDIGGVEVKNRVVRTAHGTNIGQGRVDDDLIAYHEARARGGCGLTILEAASVHRTDTGTLRIHDESAVADYQRLMDRIRPYGMRVLQQLGHLGYEAIDMDGGPPWSASALPGPGMRQVAHAMTTDDIAEVTDAFARAAGYCAAGGLDGVEVHIAHGFLLQQFLSPATNQRDDEYGGSWENRFRLAREVVAAVRSAVGADFVVGIRTGSEAVDDGLSEHDSAEVVRELEATGGIDYVNVTYGSCRRPHKIIGAMHEPVGYELPTSEVVTKVSTLPTIVTGRFRTLAEADEVIASGVADLVGMTRAHIADPDIVAKTVEGRASEVRPCIAVNDGCVGGLNRGRLSCAVNPAVGHERTRQLTPAERPQRVLVIGGGPAGMEAARTAAMRGHDVVLLEARSELGGTVEHARRMPYRSTVGDIVDWLAAELHRLGVDVRLDTTADALLATEIAADVVLVATGGKGVDLPPEAPPATVAVLDRWGGYEALGISEWLLDRGAEVTLATPDKRIGSRIQLDLVLQPTMERLADRRFELRTGVADEPDADLVLTVDKQPDGSLAEELAADGHDVHVLGDAHEPGGIMAAIHSGNAAARRI